MRTKTTVKGNEYIVEFAKPYTFEGKEYEKIDLNGLENLTTGDLAEVSKHFSTNEYLTPRPEADVTYCCMLAAIVAHLPNEFFYKLPAKEGVKVRNAVQTFFQTED